MTETTTAPVKETRIPTALAKNSILADFCRQYLNVVDEIAEYNKEVLAERDSEWNASKVLEKARSLGRPEDGSDGNADIKTALENYESAVTALALARRSVLDVTSGVLGINLSAVSERNPETEGPLKDKRKLANEIGTQLSMIAKMTTDERASSSVNEFLEANPLPAVGRDQARTFGGDEKATPKYRVNVVVTNKDGQTVVSEAGFTKAALALTKHYERGQAPKSDALRSAWEKAGNTSDNTVVNPVEFDDNELHFTISKK
jgi:hypothetical protein